MQQAAILPLIRLAAVNVHLDRRHVLHDISWTLEAGRHWAIAGPNGSGKSTLLRVIAGSQWIDPDGGSRSYSPDGIRSDVTARAATWIRHVHPEQHERYARLDLSIGGRALIESGIDDTVYVQRAVDDADARRVEQLIENFDLRDFVDRPIRTLSSGQLRRLLIARALASEPRVIVLDEFTNGLDRSARRDVLAAVEQLASRVALVVASHRHDEIPTAVTDTLTLRSGRIQSVTAGRLAPTRSASQAPMSPPRFPPAGKETVLARFAGADVYRGRRLVLQNVDWQLHRGEHVAIRGANGAGKSTFAGLLAGTIAPATGAHVERFGEPGPFDIWKLKARIVHLSDDGQIAYDRPETVEAVVASGFRDSIGLFATVTAAQAGIVDETIVRFGLDELRGRTFTGLSFGERRRVLIARSLIRRPEIIILDEIWHGLDREFRIALRAQLEQLARTGTTIVAIAHDDDDDIVSLTSRTYVIENGTIRN